ncbi:hypothetical protein C6P40_003390 [Pichia californica]|uniref:Amino acid transporter transmembrane domain-containing protein n=1 Tax=Pichia californica TaxID=460514 RepID=A0A9P6WND1_9ASCO|nr:hypothetical protein C6P40_003390 [[Candida] californica]
MSTDNKEKLDIYVNSIQQASENELSTNEVKTEANELWMFDEPDIHTRMFYAQRSIEAQYNEISKNNNNFKIWNNLIFKSLKIESLNDNGIEYPKWVNNNLSIRTTHWIIGVGLVTSEIMGAYLVPNSISMLGYIPSNIMLVIFFLVTIAAGGSIWWVFLLFDSPEYPVKTFADLAYIVGGQTCKQIVIFLQLIATLLSSATILISAAECVIILRSNRMCWVGLMILLAGIMMILSHIKSLSSLGKYCLIISFFYYINLFVQLGYIGHSEPNWGNALSVLGIEKGIIETFGITPDQSLMNKVVAICNISFVFAGSIVFPEVISEMRRPWEFWKSMCLAQILILVVYLIYGNYIYSYQGQFSNSPAVFGISNINALKGLSFMTFITGFIQNIFYGHISCKIVYKNYMPLIFKTIKFKSKRGLLLWSITVLIVWIIIFIIGAGVPQVSAVSAFTSALTMIPLTYIIPFLVHLFALYKMANENNIKDFIPLKGSDINKPSIIEYIKCGYKKYWFITNFYIIFCLASISFSGLGLWASVEYIKYIFNVTDATSFSCTSPI